jgi:O-acetylhomoserine/O-acetylserine sulfhydrylase-like pyridoxal-dependent enzyme
MQQHNVALIGFRATDKSTAGEILARDLDMEFIDMDQPLASEVNVVDSRKLSMSNAVTPAKLVPEVLNPGAGVQKDLKRLDSGFRGCVVIQ